MSKRNNFLCKVSGHPFYSYYYFEAGRRRQVSTKCRRKSEALEFVRKFRSSKASALSVKDLRDRYLEVSSPPMKAYKTYLSIESMFKEFMRIVGNPELSGVTASLVDKFLTTKIKEASVYTARKYRIHLLSAFNKAVDWDMIQANPVKKSFKIILPESDPVFFTKDEFNIFLAVVDDRHCRELFTFAVLSGLRLNELRHLKKSDVDIDKRIIRVVSDSENRTKSGKTGFVGLHKDLIPIVEACHGEYLFAEMSMYRIEYLFRKYLKRSGLNPKLRFHSLRVTFGMWLIEAGCNLKFISQQLRHSSVVVTEKYYAKYLPSAFGGEIDRLSFFL